MNTECSEIIIVSGLPRSGTSLCMRMLEAGGIPALTDRIRESDDDNPNGYYEFEPVKRTREDSSWLKSAGGKAVKMVYRLLYDLPAGYRYRVIFMRRDIHEILASQRKMLERNGQTSDAVQDAEMQQLFERELAKCIHWLSHQPHLETQEVSYNELVRDPQNVLRSLDEFLEQSLNVTAMAEVINPKLYRNRARSEVQVETPAQL